MSVKTPVYHRNNGKVRDVEDLPYLVYLPASIQICLTLFHLFLEFPDVLVPFYEL